MCNVHGVTATLLGYANYTAQTNFAQKVKHKNNTNLKEKSISQRICKRHLRSTTTFQNIFLWTQVKVIIKLFSWWKYHYYSNLNKIKTEIHFDITKNWKRNLKKLKRRSSRKYFCSFFSQNILTDLKTKIIKFELSTTFCYPDITT